MEFMGFCETCAQWFRCGSVQTVDPRLACPTCNALPRRLAHSNGHHVAKEAGQSDEPARAAAQR
ncbi:hypothetical protein ER308_18180 [Egibacter rhizosphaerae]|uniref:Uncharacterized protein n=1 Tax=Egibacter rhizosphaerae TaxID=1670831 RepID=A0A411YJD1_9ACTN|nr:hypothetical protein [Egibacter rhizosphaerae]QBI21307.1 hypothetical protein ER308_18180 [Egibacter rhizosphaerae]